MKSNNFPIISFLSQFGEIKKNRYRLYFRSFTNFFSTLRNKNSKICLLDFRKYYEKWPMTDSTGSARFGKFTVFIVCRQKTDFGSRKINIGKKDKCPVK